MEEAVSMLNRPVGRRNLILIKALPLCFRVVDKKRQSLPETV